MNFKLKTSEFDHFSELASEWWLENGKFKILHQIQHIRIKYIQDVIHKKKLHKIKILDLGCGGGIVSEGLSKLGANVTGIDASEKNIKIAEAHAKKNNLNIQYLNKSPEELNNSNKFDVILNLEIVEHVEDVNLYFESCVGLLKKNGLMFTATINRTFSSYIKAIIGAEYVLRWLPIGTHDWNKFLKPKEIENKITKLNLSIKDVKGLVFNPLSRKWKTSNDVSVNYVVVATKS